jgi:hypothetical protein
LALALFFSSCIRLSIYKQKINELLLLLLLLPSGTMDSCQPELEWKKKKREKALLTTPIEVGGQSPAQHNRGGAGATQHISSCYVPQNQKKKKKKKKKDKIGWFDTLLYVC